MKFQNIKIKRWLFIIILSSLTVLFHYIYGTSHSSILEPLHRRLCYIPIILGGLWFGVYGGVGTAAGISIVLVPFIYIHRDMNKDFVPSELIEIIFYLFIGWLIGMLSNIQQKNREENDILREKLKLSERLSTIGELLAYLMHEIRNPLNSIKGTVDIVTDQSVDLQKKIEFIGMLKDEINRLNRTLESMLKYANLRLEYKICNLLTEINMIVNLLNTQAEKSRVKINLKISENMKIYADCDKLRQVFINLVVNAIEAMPHGGTLNVMLNKIDNRYIDISFHDNGAGIPPQNFNNLFKPFFTTKHEGTGLGLAISKRIVEAHGGKLIVHSEPGKGSVFIVRLPCNQ